MGIVVNRSRANEIVAVLAEAFMNRFGLLAEIDDLVENQLPQGVEPLSRAHALFLFFTLTNDHGVKSRLLYQRAKVLYEAHPDFYDPSKVVLTGENRGVDALVGEVTSQISAKYPRAAALTWYTNARRLKEHYEGDPRRVFTCSADAREVYKAIRSFRGYGPKIGGMLLRAVVGLGFASLEHVSEILVPVDIHDSRISFYTGIAGLPGTCVEQVDYYSHARAVQNLLSEACRESEVSWLDVDRALWLIGSRGCTSRRCSLCPLQKYCGVGTGQLSLDTCFVEKRGDLEQITTGNGRRCAGERARQDGIAEDTWPSDGRKQGRRERGSGCRTHPQSERVPGE